MTEPNTETKLTKMIKEVNSIRESLPDGTLPEEIETEGIYSLVNLYAEHAAMFEVLSKRLLDVEVKVLTNEKEETKKVKEILGGSGIDKIKKEHIKELEKIAETTTDEKTKELIEEVIELKKTKRHIAVDRLRASGEQQQQDHNKQKLREDLKSAAKKREEYSESSKNFKGIPNSIQITDIHNDMHHFLLGMTEPIGDPAEPAFTIGVPATKKEKVGNEEYEYPNLVYNPNFKGTITFGGDLIQSHDSKVKDPLGAIPLCLVMRDCIKQTPHNILLTQARNLKSKLSSWKKESGTKLDSAGTIGKNLDEILKILEGKKVELNTSLNETRTSKLRRLIEELRGASSKGAAGTDEDRGIKHGDELVKLIENLKESYGTFEIISKYEKLTPNIVYVAGNHEMEALNEGQHPEVRAIMQEMLEEGLVEYCHYDRNPEPNGTFISHTKLNKPLVEVIGNDVEGYNDLFDGSKPNRKLKKIETPEQRKLLAQLLNENFAKHFEIAPNALIALDSRGINDFAIVGEELERTYFRQSVGENCDSAIENFKRVGGDLKKLEALEKMALGLAKNKIKDFQSNEINNFFELNNFVNTDGFSKTFNFELKEKDEEDKEVKKQYSIEIDENNKITVKKEDGVIIGDFTLEEASKLFAQAINSNPNSRPYSLMNRGALCNFSGGLFGYENDHPEEALDLGCSHVVGHRPTISAQQGIFVSLNTPVAVKRGNETTLQTDYNGKNEDKYVNCRITKFDSEGKPHLVGISKMLEKHREFFKKIDPQNNLDADIERLFNDVYSKEGVEKRDYENKKKKFIEYFMTNNLLMKKNQDGAVELKDESELKTTFEDVVKKLELGLELEIKVNFVEAVNRSSLIKGYQEAFSRNRQKVIGKQENIKTKALGQGQAQRQMI